MATSLEPSRGKTPITKRPYGKLMVTAVERAVVQRWDAARARAAATPGTREERIRAVRRRFRKELVTLGAAAGGSAAIPGIGTMTAVGLTASEVAWTASRSTDMILTVAAIHGHTNATPEERKAWTLALFAFDDNAAASYTELAKDLDTRGVGQRAPVSPALLDKVNSRLGRYVIAKYGARRGALVMGKLLPFGIGAAIGGAANHAMVGMVIDRADTFFEELAKLRTPPPPGPGAARQNPALPPPPTSDAKALLPPPPAPTSAAPPRDPRDIIDVP